MLLHPTESRVLVTVHPQVYNLVGWRVIGATLAVYGGLYAYERLKYTNR